MKDTFTLRDSTTKHDDQDDRPLTQPGRSYIIGRVTGVRASSTRVYVDIIDQDGRNECVAFRASDPNIHYGMGLLRDPRDWVQYIHVWGDWQRKPTAIYREGFTNSKKPRPFSRWQFVIRDYKLLERFPKPHLAEVGEEPEYF
jgi:hypothetical protein